MKEEKQLLFKALSMYLPYDVRMMSGYYLVGLCFSDEQNYNITHNDRLMKLALEPKGDVKWEAHWDMDKMQLLPLSALTEETVEELGYDNKAELISDILNKEISFELMMVLISNHYDVFELIDKGLAIDKRTLKFKT